MTAIVSKDRAKTTWLTGLAGLLLLALSLTMMALAAPVSAPSTPRPTQNFVLESNSTSAPAPPADHSRRQP
jgi:hypothetical protein